MNTKITQKDTGKHILLAGSYEKSIGRFIANNLHADGWEVWLYGRTAQKIDTERWHERSCDISSGKQIKKLIDEMPQVDACLFMADSGGHGDIETLTETQLKKFIDAKIIGSILLTKKLLMKARQQDIPIKLAWIMGKKGEKPKELMAFAVVNTGMDMYVHELNRHYSKYFQAFYIPTTLISPSVKGDAYIEAMKKGGKEIKHMAKSPQIVLDAVEKILYENIEAGTEVINGRNIL